MIMSSEDKPLALLVRIHPRSAEKREKVRRPSLGMSAWSLHGSRPDVGVSEVRTPGVATES